MLAGINARMFLLMGKGCQCNLGHFGPGCLAGICSHPAEDITPDFCRMPAPTCGNSALQRHTRTRTQVCGIPAEFPQAVGITAMQVLPAMRVLLDVQVSLRWRDVRNLQELWLCFVYQLCNMHTLSQHACAYTLGMITTPSINKKTQTN